MVASAGSLTEGNTFMYKKMDGDAEEQEIIGLHKKDDWDEKELKRKEVNV